MGTHSGKSEMKPDLKLFAIAIFLIAIPILMALPQSLLWSDVVLSQDAPSRQHTPGEEGRMPLFGKITAIHNSSFEISSPTRETVTATLTAQPELRKGRAGWRPAVSCPSLVWLSDQGKGRVCKKWAVYARARRQTPDLAVLRRELRSRRIEAVRSRAAFSFLHFIRGFSARAKSSSFSGRWLGAASGRSRFSATADRASLL